MERIVQEFARYGFQLHPQTLEILKGRSWDEIVELVNEIRSSPSAPLVIGPDDVKRVESEAVRILKCYQPSYAPLHILFKSRYEKIARMLGGRIRQTYIRNVKRSNGSVGIVGMVMEIKETGNGGNLVMLEDPTGCMKALIEEKVLPDEVLGIYGVVRNGTMIVHRIVRPEASNGRAWKGEGAAIFISDLHIGSRSFLNDAWERFVDWINLRGEECDMAKKVKYILIAGDLVEGIGVYPGQEDNLLIKDIYEQYEEAARQLSRIRSGIKIVVCPGNHDVVVRRAEPQPRHPEDIRKMFPSNVTFVSNPSLVEIGGVRVLMYHGASLLDISQQMGIPLSKPEDLMCEMLKRRHLAPVYGGETPLAWSAEDVHVIEEIPDILHCGHTHTVGCKTYRGTLVVNSGTWQEQTDYQMEKGIIPKPGIATYLDLSSKKVSALRFLEH